MPLQTHLSRRRAKASRSVNFSFKILHESKKSAARVGQICTPHGVIQTPAFVPVGTNASLKALTPSMLEELGVSLLFCNTYHLLLQPGTRVVREAGGLHAFMGRSRPIITDSGGFQVFSLAYGGVHDELKSRGHKKRNGSVLKISEEGVLFRSYRDGQKILLTPEGSVEAQKDLGADIIIPLDELPPYHISNQRLAESFERTHRWMERSLQAHLRHRKEQAMYCVVHGGLDPVLRQNSAHILGARPYDGYAIGGSLGKTLEDVLQVLTHTLPCLDSQKPRHLLGIGDLPSLEACIPYGLDSFDSSYPSKAARHGLILHPTSSYSIGKGCFATDHAPLQEGCSCKTCQTVSRAYLHHLFKSHELSAYALATVHNIHFMMEWMREVREKIWNDEI